MVGFCLSFILNTFKKNLTYRFGYFADIVGMTLSIVVQYYIWKALLGQGGASTNYGTIEFSTMRAYAVLSTVISYLTASYLLDNIASKVLKGTIATDMIRPVGIKIIYFCESLGNALFRLIFIITPLGVASFFLLSLSLPDVITMTLFIIAFVNGFLLVFLLEFAVGVLGFWFTQVHSLGVLLWTSISFLSGTLVPLWFFPQWLQAIADVMPFKYIYFVPLSIFTGTYPPIESALLIIQQLMWILVIYFAGCFLYKLGIKKLTICGG